MSGLVLVTFPYNSEDMEGGNSGTILISLAIEVVFLFVFLFYSDKRKRFALALVILAELIFMAVLAALVITLAHSWRLRSAIIGTIAAMASIAMYASPLASMKLVISTKSVEYMPFSLSLCSLLNSLCWTLYALVGIDLCILVPNGIGVLLGLAQLLLYAKYYKYSNRGGGIEKKQVHVEVDLSELPNGKPFNDA
ncbi:unnamed protein product [Cuscuta campestris]|uniref:Bidirectional sugar transporter SWEET n=1 Tax=Cuscuta campestris TaxID=132261 RepID=A0A484KRV1_9ASTE|nr:unnamed protein product [Cuscuta campestris]